MKKSIFRKAIALIMVLVMSLTCATFSAFAEDDGSVMTVTVEGSEPASFTTFNDGWV